MRTFKLIAVAALAASTAACGQPIDQGYGYGNGGGYYQPNYAAQPAYYGGSNYYAPSYYTPSPQVITQTRYVPVPVRDGNRPDDHRWDGNRGDQRGDQHHDRPQAQNTPRPGPTPTPHQPPANSGGNNQHGGNNNSHDRDGDGRPDHHN